MNGEKPPFDADKLKQISPKDIEKLKEKLFGVDANVDWASTITNPVIEQHEEMINQITKEKKKKNRKERLMMIFASCGLISLILEIIVNYPKIKETITNIVYN